MQQACTLPSNTGEEVKKGHGPVHFLSWTTSVCSQNRSSGKRAFSLHLERFGWLKALLVPTLQCETRHLSWVCQSNGGDLAMAAALAVQLRKWANTPWTQVISLTWLVNDVDCATAIEGYQLIPFHSHYELGVCLTKKKHKTGIP